MATTTDLLTLIPGARAVALPDSAGDLDAEHPNPGLNPPAEWFTTPHPDVQPGASAIITADGRFCAYSHEWSRCHVGFTNAGECWSPPRSISGNRTFHQSRIVTADGVEIPVGVIPFGDGHAPIDATAAEAQRHYDRPERVTVWARAVETDDGCVMCGSIVPGTTNRQVAMMRAAALSGDWRWIPELNAMDFIGPCFVARPGLPVGLEHAAVEQALYSIDRTAELARAASGQIMAVVGEVAAWHPAAVDNTPMSDQTTCSCKPDGVTASAPVLPSRRNRVTAAAGTGMTFRELDSAVDAALSEAFGRSDDAWVWGRDWDLEGGAGWVVFELERDDPISGAGTATYQAGLVVTDGQVTIDRSNITEVETVYQPAGGTEVDAMPMVVAHASDTAAIAELRTQIDQIGATIDNLAADMAKVMATQMEPADVVEELPEPPNPV